MIFRIIILGSTRFLHFQLSMCVVSQVAYITSHKFAVNDGFQINYQLPFNLANFYKTNYWAKSSGSSPINSFFNKLIESGDDFSLGLSGESIPTELPMNDENKSDNENGTTANFTTFNDNEETTTDPQTTTKKSKKKKKKAKIKRDVTAAEFYAGIRDSLSL